MEEGPLMSRKKPKLFHPVVIGEEAFALITEKVGKDRWNVLETASVRIVEAATDTNGGAMIKVTVLRSSGEWYVGRSMEMRRCDVYRKSDPGELEQFHAGVRMMWPSRA